MSIRPVVQTRLAAPMIEGAGVRLHRAFGFHDPKRFDPFLLFDDFRGEHPSEYQGGFPWHPHRGIETITYVLAGEVAHEDSLGNSGRLGAGDVQWMTAGSGILHKEMPSGNAAGQMHGFQIWANLPRDLKMTPPRYQEVGAREIPLLQEDDGTEIKVITGSYRGRRGPVDGVAADPLYLDVWVPPLRKRRLAIDTRRKAFAYVFEGAGRFEDASAPRGVLLEKEVAGEELNIRDLSGNRSLIEFGAGDEVAVEAGPMGLRFLVIAGAPIKEPVAWHGPIVMNSAAELQQAMAELKNGTFIKPAH